MFYPFPSETKHTVYTRFTRDINRSRSINFFGTHGRPPVSCAYVSLTIRACTRENIILSMIPPHGRVRLSYTVFKRGRIQIIDLFDRRGRSRVHGRSRLAYVVAVDKRASGFRVFRSNGVYVVLGNKRNGRVSNRPTSNTCGCRWTGLLSKHYYNNTLWRRRCCAEKNMNREKKKSTRSNKG